MRHRGVNGEISQQRHMQMVHGTRSKRFSVAVAGDLRSALQSTLFFVLLAFYLSTTPLLLRSQSMAVHPTSWQVLIF